MFTLPQFILATTRTDSLSKTNAKVKYQFIKLQCYWLPYVQKWLVQWTLPYGHLVNTATSFGLPGKNCHTFSCKTTLVKATLLIRPLFFLPNGGRIKRGSTVILKIYNNTIKFLRSFIPVVTSLVFSSTCMYEETEYTKPTTGKNGFVSLNPLPPPQHKRILLEASWNQWQIALWWTIHQTAGRV